ncbi:MAG: SGNH/GDSL hydrolase family protein [Oscillospiraceae bacterium]|nr:SGNH/GDSL hydrolase family protein [Oscillospiraceae bacterium]
MNNNLIDSLYHSGNNFRLKKALEKEQIKLAFIGGSVTKGWDGKGYISENYTCHIKKYFSDLYPDKRFESYNLSTESANSFIGLSITGKVIDDILPDIVFIEYAVNNECGHDQIVSYESLVKRILALPSSPAVALVLLMNQSLYSSQGYMKRISSHYDITSVSVADSLKKMLDEGFQWSVYADDTIHPNRWGHRYIADCIINALDNMISSEMADSYCIPGPLYSLDFADYQAVSAVSENVLSEGFEKIECGEYGEYFNTGLKMIPGKKSAKICVEGEFKNLFAAFVHDKTDRFSDAELFIDNEKKAVLQGRSIYGWGNVTLRNIYAFESKGHHKVELKIKDTKKEFILIEFGIA